MACSGTTLLWEKLVRYVKEQEKNRLSVSVLRTVTSGINYNFSDSEQRESKKLWTVFRENCRQRRKLMYLTAKSFSHQLQFLVESEINIFIPRNLDHQHYR
jgi:hypothetical protein